MSRKKKIILSVSVIILIALSIFVYLRFRAILAASERRGMPTPFVEVITPERGDISSVINFSGDILAIEQTNIFSRVNGNIEKIFVDAGLPPPGKTDISVAPEKEEVVLPPAAAVPVKAGSRLVIKMAKSDWDKLGKK